MQMKDIIVFEQLNMTPLHWACEHNHVEIAKILLRAGARLDVKSKVRLTAGIIAFIFWI